MKTQRTYVAGIDDDDYETETTDIRLTYLGRPVVCYGPHHTAWYFDGQAQNGGLIVDSPEWFAAEHIAGCGSIKAARDRLEERLYQEDDRAIKKDFREALDALDDFTE